MSNRNNKPPCKFYQQGHCRNGNRCPFPHVDNRNQGNGGFGKNNGTFSLEKEVEKFADAKSLDSRERELVDALESTMKEADFIVTSSMGFGYPATQNLITGRDYQFEESRWDYYQAQQQNAVPQYEQMMNNRVADMKEYAEAIRKDARKAARYSQLTAQAALKNPGQVVKPFLDRPLDLTKAPSSSSFNSSPFGAQAANPFGGSTQTSNPFGGSTQTSNLFGGSTTSSSGAFGSTGFGSTTAATNNSNTSPFGAKTGSAFGSSGFGGTSAFSGRSSLGGNAASSGSAFGGSAFGSTGFGGASLGPKPAATGSAFGSASFGSTPAAGSSTSPFGALGGASNTNTSGSAFGSAGFGSAPAQNTSSAFGSSAFGSAATSSSPFGSLGNNNTSGTKETKASPFGSLGGSTTTNSAVGQQQTTTTSPFGQTNGTASAFGQPTQTSTTSAFGQPSQPSPFGQTTQSSPFGQQSQLSPFGQQSQSSAFGSGGFGQAFGNNNQPFTPQFTQSGKEPDRPTVDDLSDEIKAHFEAQEFTLGKIPEIEPPLSLC